MCLVILWGRTRGGSSGEFEDKDSEYLLGRGDVKYHQGYHNDWITAKAQRVHLALTFNPSHLEFVNPVVEGRMRARMDREGDPNGLRGLVVLIHGDAAFAGEGIVQETLNLSELEGYSTGGTIHIILNNQIGFTTNPWEGRSSGYCTDVAKMLQIPVFHVNGEEPESVAQVINLAMEFRRTFQRDVVIDMYCYRRRGHNEGDEPAFTQPLLYNEIRNRPSVRDGYLEHLLKLGGVTREEADEIAQQRRQLLEEELDLARRDDEVKMPPWEQEAPHTKSGPKNKLRVLWSRYKGGLEEKVIPVRTGVEIAKLKTLLEALTKLPKDFTPNPKIARLLEQKLEMARGERRVDWATAEALAMASLATQGVRVRMSGQDSQRGTFSHRHAVLHDVETGASYMPLQNLSPLQAPVEIYNSPLSEAGVLGFEYGYSVGMPDGLTIWEAQFGDFANAAQVIIDQFIASAEDKWRRLTGLVMMLPHGLEGTGPEHASARPERYLTLAAEDNLQLVQPTTPANLFHVLRRQVLGEWRKPLFLLTPKSMLRHEQATSTLEELAEGSFERFLPDEVGSKQKMSRVLLCTGKLYYDLAAHRAEHGRDDVAIVRLEQMYPINEAVLEKVLEPYPKNTPVIWVQEEPENSGAWRFLLARFGIGGKLLGTHAWRGVSRPASASPATGSAKAHKLEQEQVIREAFSDFVCHDGSEDWDEWAGSGV